MKPFGFWTAVALVVGNMVGTGIYFLPAALAVYGTLSLVGFILSAIGAMCLAYVFAVLTIHNPRSGGPYTHGQAIFGDWVGFFLAWGYWIMNWTGSSATAVAIVSYCSTFVPELVHNRILAFELALGIVWGVTLINCAGLRFGGAVQVGLTALKLIPLLIVPIAALFWFDPHNFVITTANDHSASWAINASAALAIWSFIGLEAATVPSERIHNPRKTIARATLLGTGVVAVLYLMTSIALFGVIPVADLAKSPVPFVDVAKIVFGDGVAPFIAFCVIISGLGGINGWILLHGQVAQVMARDHLFPKPFAHTSRGGTPVLGLVVGSVLITLMMMANYQDSLLDQFVQAITVGSVMTLFAYLAAAIAGLRLLKGMSLAFRVACIVAAVYSLWAIWGAGEKILAYCAIGYLIGMPVYLYVRLSSKNAAKSMIAVK